MTDNQPKISKRTLIYEAVFLSLSFLFIVASIFISGKEAFSLGNASVNNYIVMWRLLTITLMYLAFLEITLFIYVFGYIRLIYSHVSFLKFIIYAVIVHVLFTLLGYLFIYFIFMSNVGVHYTGYFFISLSIFIFEFILLSIVLRKLKTRRIVVN